METSKQNVCTDFHVDCLRNVFLRINKRAKIATFRGISTHWPTFQYYYFNQIICNKRLSKVIFRPLDDRQTYKHAPGAQISQILIQYLDLGWSLPNL